MTINKLTIEEVQKLIDCLRTTQGTLSREQQLSVLLSIADTMRENEELHAVINSMPELLQRYKESEHGH